MIADNKLAENAGWDEALLKIEVADLASMGFDIPLLGFSEGELAGFGSDAADDDAASLAERFGIPPFSVLNAREGWWQDRKAAWIGLGIQSELGRGAGSEPGGSKMPIVNPTTGKVCRSDSHARPIAGTDAGTG